MAKSPLSVDVQAANSKLAQFLRGRQEEEMILQIGKRKPKLQKEAQPLPGGRGRWALEPDYKAPSPLIDRPRTEEGATSFHFSYSEVKKTVPPTIDGKPIEGRLGREKSAALDHSKYIERDGAAEISRGAEHAAYVERPEAVEVARDRYMQGSDFDPMASLSEAPNAAEMAIIGGRPEVRDGVPSIFSNISDDTFERQEFWRAVERTERTPEVHEIMLDPEVLPAWWAELRNHPFPDAGFKEHALQVHAEYQDHLTSSDRNGAGKPFKSRPLSVTAERAGRIIQAARQMAAYEERLSPIEFKSGRGGRTQIRFVAELPYEVSPEDRALIVQNFCDYLSALEERANPDGSTKEVGLMYTAVIHAPDAHNDSRNYHLHIVAYSRPARFLSDEGLWDFEYEEHYDHKGELRRRKPLRQKKIKDPTRGDKKKNTKRRLDENFVKRHRIMFAAITNRVLEARGVSRRIDPRRYTEMGIDRTPTEHLGTKAAALESIGVDTTVGRLNAIAIWGDAERSIQRQAREADKAHKTAQADLDKLDQAVSRVDPTHTAMPRFRTLIAERSRLIETVADDRREIMTFDHLEAKAKSRAIRTRQTCLQFLTDIEKGRADLNTRIMRQAIRDRWQGAQNHINDIDQALAPHRAALAAAARNVEAREQRILEINKLLDPLKLVLEERLGMSTMMKALLDREAITAAPKRASSLAGVASEPEASAQPNSPAGEAPAGCGISDPATAIAPHLGPPSPAVAVNTLAAGNEPKTPFVPIQPASIEGLPIVQPTIAPRRDVEAPSPADLEAVPPGLEPLRPIPEQQPSAGTGEIVIHDLNNPIQAASERKKLGGSDVTTSTDREGSEAPPTHSSEPAPSRFADGVGVEPKREGIDPPGTVTGPAESPGAALQEEKVDRRRRPSDPTLFELPEQAPPIKPGTTKAEYVDWDALIKRIADQRVPVKMERLQNGTYSYSAPALDHSDQQLLRTPRFANRTNGRLGSIYERQQQEVQRLIRWIQTHGQNPAAISLEGRTVTLGREARQAVRTLFQHWGRHSSVLEALRYEYDRRAELAKLAGRQPKPKAAPVEEVEEDLAARREEAARLYPTPDQAHTPQVAEFIRLLREAAPGEKLRQVAEEIYNDPAARDDINYHTVELATAYSTCRGDSDEIARGIGRGSGWSR